MFLCFLIILVIHIILAIWAPVIILLSAVITEVSSTYLYNENHIEQSLSYYFLCDKQYDSHHLFFDSNKMPDHHLAFPAFLFHHSHSCQYLSITGEYVLAFSCPASSNIKSLPMPHPTTT